MENRRTKTATKNEIDIPEKGAYLIFSCFSNCRRVFDLYNTALARFNLTVKLLQ